MTRAVELAQIASAGVSEAFKNRLINGAMQIWQRGTSFTGSSSLAYYADRWSAIQFAGSTSTISRVSGAGLSGANFVMQCQRPNAATNTGTINLGQSIESENCLGLAGNTVTLSFWARAGAGFSASGNILTTQITSGTGTDQNVYSTYTGAVTQSQNNTLTTSLQRFTQTVTIPSDATEVAIVLFYTPTGTAGAADFYQLGLVQLEVGSVASSFEHRPVGTELALCQRYYEKSFPIGTAPANGIASTEGTDFSAYYSGGGRTRRFDFKVTKRATPTVTVYGGSASSATNVFGYYTFSAWVAFTTTSPESVSDSAFRCECTRSGSFTNGLTYLLDGNWAASSEI